MLDRLLSRWALGIVVLGVVVSGIGFHYHRPFTYAVGMGMAIATAWIYLDD